MSAGHISNSKDMWKKKNRAVIAADENGLKNVAILLDNWGYTRYTIKN